MVLKITSIIIASRTSKRNPCHQFEAFTKRILPTYVVFNYIKGDDCLLRRFKESEKTMDLYERTGFILKSLLTYELRDLPVRYEFWYKIAIQQEAYRTLQHEHRTNISMYSAVGRFHQMQYEIITQKYSRLERLADVYKFFCMEEERALLNRRLSFYEEHIISLYNHILNKELYTYCDHVQQQFWEAACEDLLTIIAHLD